MTAPAPTLVAKPYPLGFQHMHRGRFGDLLTVDLRLMLVTSAYTPADADEWASTPAAAEAAGTGYVAGGLAVPNRTVGMVAGRSVLGCDAPVWPAAGFTARWGVIYVAAAGGLAESPLLAYLDFTADQIPNGTDFEITFASGVHRLGPVAATP